MLTCSLEYCNSIFMNNLQVIFADGTFIDGSTSELSCDGPLREPYAVFCQVLCTYLSFPFFASIIMFLPQIFSEVLNIYSMNM